MEEKELVMDKLCATCQNSCKQMRCTVVQCPHFIPKEVKVKK